VSLHTCFGRSAVIVLHQVLPKHSIIVQRSKWNDPSISKTACHWIARILAGHYSTTQSMIARQGQPAPPASANSQMPSADAAPMMVWLTESIDCKSRHHCSRIRTTFSAIHNFATALSYQLIGWGHTPARNSNCCTHVRYGAILACMVDSSKSCVATAPSCVRSAATVNASTHYL
jgi:hypothetical protein